MGGNGGSGYSKKDVKQLRDEFEDNINGDSSGAGSQGSGEELGEAQDITNFPIECDNGYMIDADVSAGILIVSMGDASVEISFEDYEIDFSEEFGYDFCEAADAIFNKG